MSYEVRHGRWQDQLRDVDRCDVMIVDAPYSEKVHKGSRTEGVRDGIDYGYMTPEQVGEHVSHWSPIVEGWFITITCHVLAPVWTQALEQAGRYVFAPQPYIDPSLPPRFIGDGPPSLTCWVVCARPRTKTWIDRWKARKRSPAGYYIAERDPRPKGQRGGKPIGIMRAIVRDYTWPGDLVIDTHAGSGTTLAAAAAEGRVGLGAEVNRDSWRAAQPNAASTRLADGTIPIF